MLNMNKLTIDNNQYLWLSDLRYETNDYEYYLSVTMVDDNFIVYLNFIIFNINVNGKHKYYSSNNVGNISKDHILIIQEMISLFETLIILPARLEGKSCSLRCNF